MEIKTKNGLIYNLNEEMLGDYEIFNNLVKIEQGEGKLIPATIDALLGKDGHDQLINSCRNEKGRAPTEDVVAAFGEILVLAGKKSSKKK